ncbi:MAG TPA: hypothetical protein VMZ00_07350 [Sporichthya sp.]|nr:hypothetical protein [Sporichthya sp.]
MTLGQIGAAAPAFAHGGGESAADLPAADTVARAVALAAAALLAGVALIRPLAGRPTDAARGLLATVGVAGAVAALAGAVGNLDGPRYLLLVPLLALTSTAVLLHSDRVRVLAVPTGIASVVWLCWGAITDSVGDAILMLGHVAVAVIWAGAVLASATAEAGTRAALVRRLGPIALGAGVLASVTGVLSARNYDVTLHGITVTDFGTVVVLKVVLLVAAASLGVGVRVLLRGRRSPGPQGGGVLARLELGVLVTALVAGAVLTSLPPPGPTPVAGAPMVRALTLDDATTGLAITPQRPGLNLVHVMTDRLTDVVVGGRQYRAEARPGTQGFWAEVQLPAGRSLLEIRQGRQVAAQIVNTGSGPVQAGLSGPDGAECAAAAIGAFLGGARVPLSACPSGSLSPVDAGALGALVGNLKTRGVHVLRLITDTTPRGIAAEKVIRGATKKAGIGVLEESAPATAPGKKPDATLAIAGWDVAQAALHVLRETPAPLYGTYLAPWLVQAGIVAAAGGSPLSPLPFDPTSPQAQAYITALRAVGPTESASSAGLLAFLAARGQTLPAKDVLLYAATGRFDIMPIGGDLTTAAATAGHDHDGVDASWLGGGALTPVSGRLG